MRSAMTIARWLVVLTMAGSLGAACAGSTTIPGPTAEPAHGGRPGADPAPEVNATPDVPRGAAASRDAELAVKAASFIDAFANYEPRLARDGKKVVFLSNRDGLAQIYVADAARPEAPATRVLEWPQRVSGVMPSEDGKSVLFRSDKDADERWSFYRVDLDGNNLVELTPGERLNRDAFAVARHAPESLFFSARNMSKPSSSVYAASAVKGGEAKKIYTDEKPAFLRNVSPDGKWGLLVRFLSISENYLLLLDLTNGQAKPFLPAAGGKFKIHSAAFSADGERVYVATDGGAEQALVLALDRQSGKELARYVETKPATAQLGGIVVAETGGLMAFSLVAGQHSEIRVLDGKTLEEKVKVDMPLGMGTLGDFSRDGKRLTATWSTPRIPTDLFVIDTKTGKVTPLRREERPSLKEVPPIEAAVVEIDAFDGGKIPINLYLMAGEADEKHPVIVSYHGGPNGTAMISWDPLAAYFLSLGYVFVLPNVRGSSGFGRAFEEADNGRRRLDAFRDIETSARWAARQAWADEDRMVVFGESYGGYTALVALSRWPDLWRAGVDLVGIVNMKTLMATTSDWIRELLLIEFGDPDADAEFLASISPYTDVDKIVDPTFVYAGANDPRVPMSESDLIVKALRQRRIPSEYMVAADEGHSVVRRHNQIALYSRAARFLETHLK